jgi:predicted RNA-binding Zn ribbon-like protein
MCMSETELQTPVFEFTGKRLCLDFANTVNNRIGNPRELLNSYDDLLTWSQEAQILIEQEVESLRERARRHPGAAAEVLTRAVAVREAIYAIFVTRAHEVTPASSDVDRLNTELTRANTQMYLVPEQEGFVWDWAGRKQELDAMLWPVVRSAADVLTSEELQDVRVCASDDCGWVFLDTSKNHSRRWCDMKGCGNRAKARKHYSQKKQAS